MCIKNPKNKNKTGNDVTVPMDLLKHLPVQAQMSGKLTWTQV